MGLGVSPEKTFTDQGLTGADRARPGLGQALAACLGGDTRVVTKLDRLARSLRDAKDIVDELTPRQAKLNFGGSVHDPTDSVGNLAFNVRAMVGEFQADLIRARTREGIAVATTKSRLCGKQPKLSKAQEAYSVSVLGAGTHTPVEIAELFGVARSTIYRALKRASEAAGQIHRISPSIPEVTAEGPEHEFPYRPLPEQVPLSPTVRQAIRMKEQMLLLTVRVTSQATRSSKLRVNRER